MKIETKKLSKDALVELVNIVREATNLLPDSLIRDWYRQDLVNQLKEFSKQFEKLESELQRGKLSIKAHNVKVEKLNRLAVTGNKKLATLKELDNASK